MCAEKLLDVQLSQKKPGSGLFLCTLCLQGPGECSNAEAEQTSSRNAHVSLHKNVLLQKMAWAPRIIFVARTCSPHALLPS